MKNKEITEIMVNGIDNIFIEREGVISRALGKTGEPLAALDMLMRLETMVLMAGLNLPLHAIRQQVASAIEFIIHLGKTIDGKRKVLNITELLGLENGEYKTQEIFAYQQQETDNAVCFSEGGKLVYCGNAIQNSFKFKAAGMSDYTRFLK